MSLANANRIKPLQHTAMVRFSHPLVSSLVGCWLLGEGYYVRDLMPRSNAFLRATGALNLYGGINKDFGSTGALATTVGFPRHYSHRSGYSSNYFSTTTIPPELALPVSGESFTVVSRIAFGVDSRAHGVFSVYNDANNNVRCQITNAFAFYVNKGGANYGGYTFTNAGKNKWQTAFFLWDDPSNTPTIAYDNNAPASLTSQTGSAPNVGISVGYPHDNVGYGYNDYVYVFNRVLTADERASLTDNPYQIFEAPRRRMIFTAAAAGGGSVPNFMHQYRQRRILV